MLFDRVQVTNYRSIADSGEIPLGRITVIVGRNNVGKSALIRAVHMIQTGASMEPDDIRLGEDQMTMTLNCPGVVPLRPVKESNEPPLSQARITWSYQRGVQPEVTVRSSTVSMPHQPAPQVEPDNLVYPIFSGRRQARYQEQVRRNAARTIMPNDTNLVSRVMDHINSNTKDGRRFQELCEEVLGQAFNISSDDNFQRISVRIDRFQEILLEAMGSGLSSSLNLLVSLSGARQKLFLVEEPETDLHPHAIRRLCAAIIESSNNNQFIVSTHSGVVLAALGAERDTVVLHATSDGELPPTSTYTVVDTPEGRMAALRDLGYELADVGLYEGWIVFEEASAERIVREFLIPWFAPRLLSLRTIGATGVSRVGPILANYKEMLLFAHLEPMYRGRAWVLVDGDEAGKEVIKSLRRDFKDWPPDRFGHFDQPQFELYYPTEFQQRAVEVLADPDQQRRKKAKADLLLDVVKWLNEDADRAKMALAASAGEVVAKLQRIEETYVALGR